MRGVGPVGWLLSCGAGCTPLDIWVEGDLPPDPPPGFSVRTLDPVTVGDTVDIEIDDATTALQILVRLRNPGAGDTVGFTVVDGPDGQDHHAGRLDAEAHLRWPELPEHAGHALGGTWQVRTRGADGLADVTVLEWADRDPAAGTVHVQVVYADEVATPAVEAEVEAAVAFWQEMWAPYGLSVSAYYQESNAPRRCPSAWPSRGHPVYEALSAAGADHDVTVVVCDRLANGNPLGISYSGPLVASPEAALAVRIDAGRPGRLGQTIAHEIAHYAGMRHTDVDALDDTPDCDGLDVLECQAEVGQNLMYATAICPTPFDRVEGAEDVDGCLLQDRLTDGQLYQLHTWVGTTE